MAKEKGWKSFAAGATAGAIEGVVTYPFEFAKTRLQLVDRSATASHSRNPIKLILNVARSDGVGAIYAGCVPAVIGNTAKAGVRFLGFDTIRNALKDENGHITPFRGFLAGLGAGVLESVAATTPGESVKTAFIDDRQRAHPRYAGNFFRGVSQLIKDEGIMVLYRGLIPVTARQAANQTVRLGSYSFIKGTAEGMVKRPLNSLETFGVGSLVGTITVYATMPVDTVKTRMQAVDAKKQYTGMIDCFTKVVKNEGVKTLWRGSTARLGRLVLSGGIVFTVYEQIMRVL